MKVPVPVTTAVLGGEAEVQTLAGKPARLRIPPLTQNGQVFRLKGYGMPAVGKPDEKGDLYARVEVQLPTGAVARPSGSTTRRSAKLSGDGADARHSAGVSEQNMNLNKFTEKAQEAVVDRAEPGDRAQPRRGRRPSICSSRSSSSPGGIVPSILRKLTLDPARVAAEARGAARSLPQAYGADVRLSPRMKLIFDSAQAEAQRLQDEFVSTEHLLVALATEAGRSPAAQLLQRIGATKDALYAALTAGARQPARHVAESRSPPTRRSPATGAI